MYEKVKMDDVTMLEAVAWKVTDVAVSDGNSALVH